MAFSGVTQRGEGGVDTGGGNLVITIGANIVVGRAVFMLLGKDNVNTSSTTSEITSVTDSSGHTWLSAGRITGASAANGCTYSELWYLERVLTQIDLNDTVTIVKTTDVDCCASVFEVTMAADKKMSLAAVDSDSHASDAPAMVIGSLSNIERLYVNCLAIETEDADTLVGVTSGYTQLEGAISSTVGGTTTNVSVTGEYIIATATGHTSDPDSVAGDVASVFAAFEELAYSAGGGAGRMTLLGVG